MDPTKEEHKQPCLAPIYEVIDLRALIEEAQRQWGQRCGAEAASIFDNPYWVEYPKPSAKGERDEILARHFVDGYFSKERH